METTPVVSVIVPVYNVEKYLRQCLDSVLVQTLSDIELICVDDSSTDSSPEILREYEKKDARVSVYTQPNAGAGAARNRGLDHACGEYLLFLDSDDFFEPDMLEKAVGAARKDDCDIVVFHSDQYLTEKSKYQAVSWVIKDKAIPPYRPFKYRQLTDDVFWVFIGWAWDKLYRADFVRQHELRFQEQRTTNDMLFVFSSLVLAQRMSVIGDVLVHQRRDSKDSLSKTRENSWWCFHDALMALKERLVREGLFRELEKDFVNYAVHFTLWNFNTLAEPTKSLLAKKIKEEWNSEFGIAKKPEGYFYRKSEYRQYREIIEEPKDDNHNMAAGS